MDGFPKTKDLTSNLVVQLHAVHLVNALDLVQTGHFRKVATLYRDAGLAAARLQKFWIQVRGRRKSSDQLRRLNHTMVKLNVNVHRMLRTGRSREERMGWRGSGRNGFESRFDHKVRLVDVCISDIGQATDFGEVLGERSAPV